VGLPPGPTRLFFVEIVRVARCGDITIQRIRAGKRAALSGTNLVGSAATGHFTLALPDDHHGRVSVSSCLNAVLTRLRNRKNLVRRVYFEDFVGPESLHPEI